jgi:hypothetical protein
VVVLGNKAGHKDRKVNPKKAAAWPRKKNLTFYETSVKSGKNITAGFLHLVRTLTGDRSIEFVDRSAQRTPNKSTAKEAALVSLPEEDEEGY